MVTTEYGHKDIVEPFNYVMDMVLMNAQVS